MQRRRIPLGRISGVYGIGGWVKVFSDTHPRDQITRYNPIQLGREGQWREARIEAGRSQGKGVVMKLEGYDDRDAAAALMGTEIAVWRDQLAPLPEGEFYWADLIGLEVRTLDDVSLGHVDHLFETGANDVIVVKGEREHLVPCVFGQVVRQVDPEQGLILVDWDPDY